MAPGYWEPDYSESLQDSFTVPFWHVHCLMNTRGQTQSHHVFYSSLQPSPINSPFPLPQHKDLSTYHILRMRLFTCQAGHLGHCPLRLPSMGSHYLLKPHGINANLKPSSSDSDRIWLAIPVLLHPRQVILDMQFTLLELQPINLLTEQQGLDGGGVAPCKVHT